MPIDVRTFGDPVLREKADPIRKVELVQKLAESMIETMRIKQGLGLAAQQIGKTVHICVIELPPEMDVAVKGGPRLHPDVNGPIVAVNLEIVDASGKVKGNEGCLSFPEVYADIPRFEEITARYTDLAGKEKVLKARGLLARAFQHELDHLNAVLIVDRMSAAKRLGLSGKLRRIRKETLAKAGAA